MRFDDEGHLFVTPREVEQQLFRDPWALIQDVLLPGTPVAFPTYGGYCRFLSYFADCLKVHPRNLLIKGSTKIGFSVAPRPEKVWTSPGADSDLDLAIIDPHYYQMVDEEVRHWERDPRNESLMVENRRFLHARRKRIRQKGLYYCFRYFDLPPIPFVQQHNGHLERTPVEECCGVARGITAFIYRDWWGVSARYRSDLDELARKLRQRKDPLPAAGDEPRPRSQDSEPGGSPSPSST